MKYYSNNKTIFFFDISDVKRKPFEQLFVMQCEDESVLKNCEGKGS